ncbi:class I glutamine amidotransferase-like protein [Lojkania enalia]|uniref:Class I glutamine amidotransferase-like protein n=1 Tax=Lojkania enalia TaxID=147567 RepID=A0A9P4K088_9PLEO|nr:class I glutamine amidotransferase-like protein [Didymosphaeria enalia]
MSPTIIGVLIVSPIQLLDLSPIDLFAMMTRSYFEACRPPQPLLDLSIPDKDLKIIYVSSSGPNTVAQTTANVGITINVGLDDPAVAPRKLDILLIPGPPPFSKPDEKSLEFVRRHVNAGVDLLTVCSGILVAGYAGVLDGKHCTCPRGIDHFQKEFPKALFKDKRWVRDGRLWTSGGISNGLDLIAAYIKYRWPGPLPDTVLKMADVEPRGQDYGTNMAGMRAWWAWHLLKVWIGGLVGRNKKSD